MRQIYFLISIEKKFVSFIVAKVFMTSGNNKPLKALHLSLQEMVNRFVVGSSKKDAATPFFYWHFNGARRGAQGMYCVGKRN